MSAAVVLSAFMALAADWDTVKRCAAVGIFVTVPAHIDIKEANEELHAWSDALENGDMMKLRHLRDTSWHQVRWLARRGADHLFITGNADSAGWQDRRKAIRRVNDALWKEDK